MKKHRCHTTGKKRFRDEIAAKLAMSSINMDGNKRVYRCGFCRGWHMTSQEQRTEKVSRQLTSGSSG